MVLVVQSQFGKGFTKFDCKKFMKLGNIDFKTMSNYLNLLSHRSVLTTGLLQKLTTSWPMKQKVIRLLILP